MIIDHKTVSYMPSNFAKYQTFESFLRRFCIFILSKNSIYHKKYIIPHDGRLYKIIFYYIYLTIYLNAIIHFFKTLNNLKTEPV